MPEYLYPRQDDRSGDVVTTTSFYSHVTTYPVELHTWRRQKRNAHALPPLARGPITGNAVDN